MRNTKYTGRILKGTDRRKHRKMLATGLLLGAMAPLLLVGCGKKETTYFLEETGTESLGAESTATVNEDLETGEQAENLQAKIESGQTEAWQREAGNTEVLHSEETEEVCFVYVCGAVEKPGVYELESGSRIFQAVELAGGLTEEACGEYVNQAQEIGDGMKIYVPTVEQVRQGDVPDITRRDGDGETYENRENTEEEGLVNINTAGKEQLMTLPGIGESRALSIIAYREEYGAFAAKEDIMCVSGIKEGAFAKLKEHICVQ